MQVGNHSPIPAGPTSWEMPPRGSAALCLWVPKGLGEQGGIPQSWHCQPGGFSQRCSSRGWIPWREGMEHSGSQPSEGWRINPSIPCCPSSFPSRRRRSRREARLRTLHCAAWGLSPFAPSVRTAKCVTAAPRPRRGLGRHRRRSRAQRAWGDRMEPLGTRRWVVVAAGTRLSPQCCCAGVDPSLQDRESWWDAGNGVLGCFPPSISSRYSRPLLILGAPEFILGALVPALSAALAACDRPAGGSPLSARDN